MQKGNAVTDTKTDPEPCILNDFDEGVQGGIAIVIDLVRAGASIDEVAELLDSDEAIENPAEYQAKLAELRKILGTDFPSGGSDER
jgi:hypothetical protein